MDRRRFLLTSSLTGVAAVAQTKTLPSLPHSTLTALELMDITNVPGYALVGHLDGRPVAEFAGVRANDTDPAKRQAVNAETYFPAASFSKVVFYWGVRELVRQGKLDWNKPLQDYLPLGLEGDAAKITALHVVSHCTGLINWRFNAQADQRLASSSPPGTRFSYSGEGFFLLQRVVERLVGESVASHMKKNVLPGLGITSGSLAWSPAFMANGALGHTRQGEIMERSAVFYETSSHDVIKAAGLDPETATISEVTEVYKKANRPTLPVMLVPNVAGSMWLRPAEFGNFLVKVLTDATKTPAEYAAVTHVNGKMSWGRGWAVDHTNPGLDLWSYGDASGFKNFAYVSPARKTAIAIFTNGERGTSLYGGMIRSRLRLDLAPLYWV
jgi:CubicO group peptidase (beta-lactamase class C family)